MLYHTQHCSGIVASIAVLAGHGQSFNSSQYFLDLELDSLEDV